MRESVCERETERIPESESKCVCVREIVCGLLSLAEFTRCYQHLCVCVCERERERERMSERKSKCV